MNITALPDDFTISPKAILLANRDMLFQAYALITALETAADLESQPEIARRYSDLGDTFRDLMIEPMALKWYEIQARAEVAIEDVAKRFLPIPTYTEDDGQ